MTFKSLLDSQPDKGYLEEEQFSEFSGCSVGQSSIHRANICHKYHKLYLWRKNFHVEIFWEILEQFWEILENFRRFFYNLRAFMWRKIEPKMYICGEKMTNMRSESHPSIVLYCTVFSVVWIVKYSIRQRS